MQSERRWNARVVAVGIALWLALITCARVVLNQPGLALSFLSLFAICAAAYRFGRRGALVVAATSTLLFVGEELLVRRSAALRETETLLVATASRLVVFFGIGLFVAELLTRQVRLARRLAERDRQVEELASIRDALTPATMPEIPGLKVAATYEPAETGVAGDFFMAVPGRDGSALIAIGDVVGHGLAAARRAAFVRTTLASFAAYALDPSELLRLANVALYQRDSHVVEFVTVTCVRVWPKTGDVAWAQAGHPPPLSLDTGEPLGDGPAYPPLGIDEELLCDTRRARLAPNEGLILVSDGLLEARRKTRDAPIRLFGENRVREELLRHRGASPEEIVSALGRAAASFAGGKLPDDLTVLAARLDPVSD